VTVRTAALTVETLRLDGHADPERLRAAWTQAETKGLTRLVQFEGCALWLRRRLVQINVGEASDRQFRVWLERRSREIAARNLLVDAQTDRVGRALSDAGVPFVLIKGAARRALVDTIPYVDARATYDVDILVPAESAWHAWEQLRAAGYAAPARPAKRSARIPPGHFHLPPVLDHSRVAVELHTSTSSTVSPEEAWRRATAGARRVERSGLVMPVQSCPTELVWHAVTHAFSHKWKAFRLRFLLDAAAVWAAGMTVNWPEIGRRLDSREIRNRYYAVQWLGAAAALAGVPLPERIAGRAPPFDLRFVLMCRLVLLRRMSLNSRLTPKILDRLAHVVIAADWWRSIQGTRPARASSLTTSH
jgi:hypothetical protein